MFHTLDKIAASQPEFDQFQKPSNMDPLTQLSHQDVVVDPNKKVALIQIYHLMIIMGDLLPRN